MEEENAVAYGCLPSPARKNWETKTGKQKCLRSGDTRMTPKNMSIERKQPCKVCYHLFYFIKLKFKKCF